MGFAYAQEPPLPRPPSALTFKSMSRTHLSTRWLVQTTGSMFCVSQRARRSCRACGEGDWVSCGGPGGHAEITQEARVRGAGRDLGMLMRGILARSSTAALAMLVLSFWEMGRSLLPAMEEPRGRATCLQSVGPGGALGSCLVCVAQPPPAWFV